MAEKKEKKSETEWDIRKIVLVLALIIFVLVAGVWLKRGYFAQINSQRVVKDASTEVPNLQKVVQSKIEDIKGEAAKINVEEVATSSPQMQKVINDLKSIQNYPSSQARSMCEKICNGL
ncbi:hypothetical protein M1349_04460 [Patescibacteria group bacterium]|nr:hypothetical protein [Patescibacteria group bacterium]